MAERTGARRFAIRLLEPGEILEEAPVRLHPAFPLPWETALTALSRRYLRTRARLQKVFVGPLENQSLLVQTPVGLALTWRIWGEILQVVRATPQIDGSVILEPGVVSIPAHQTRACQFLIDRILTELPPWSR